MKFKLTALIIFVAIVVCQEEIMFMAYVEDRLGIGYISFNGLKLDYGNSIDHGTGIFTAPTNGTYEFSMSMTNQKTRGTNIIVEKNGMEELQFQSGAISVDSFVPTWLMSLFKDDKIRLKIISGQLNAQSIFPGIWIGRLLNPQTVVFSSYEDDDNGTSSGILNFGKSIINIGNAFNSSVFKAPASGIYHFSFIANSDIDSEAEIKVMKNDVDVLSFQSSSLEYQAISPTFMIELEKDDLLWLNVAKHYWSEGTIVSYPFANRIFNGRLLHVTSGAVMFSAYSKAEEIIYKDSYIGFDKNLVNIGGGFDNENGIFKAPVSGTYEFAFSANADTGWICTIYQLKVYQA